MDDELLQIAEDFLKMVSGDLDKYVSEKGIIETDKANLSVSLFTPEHIQFARYGRGPGKQPPVSEILKFVKAKNIKFENTSQEGTAWAIAKSIAKNGTKNFVPNAPNFLEETLKKYFDAYFNETNKAFTRVLVKDINTTIEQNMETYKELRF